MKRTFLALALALALAGPARAAETFQIDRAHSEVSFQIRHMMSKVRGRFQEFSGTLALDKAHPEASSVEFVIQAKSIDTDTERRDNHLRSPDFFDVEKFPEIRFKSTKVVAKGGNNYEVTGEFSMRGVTRTITLPVTFLGFMAGPPERAGFELTTTLNRKDYGIVWNKALDATSTLLGDEVTVNISLETIVPAPAK